MTTVGALDGRGPRFLEPAEPPIATPLLIIGLSVFTLTGRTAKTPQLQYVVWLTMKI